MNSRDSKKPWEIKRHEQLFVFLTRKEKKITARIIEHMKSINVKPLAKINTKNDQSIWLSLCENIQTNPRITTIAEAANRIRPIIMFNSSIKSRKRKQQIIDFYFSFKRKEIISDLGLNLHKTVFLCITESY